MRHWAQKPPYEYEIESTHPNCFRGNRAWALVEKCKSVVRVESAVSRQLTIDQTVSSNENHSRMGGIGRMLDLPSVDDSLWVVYL
jgi:hypothetical protein